MNLQFVSKQGLAHSKTWRRGTTLPEMMMAVGVGSLVLMVIGMIFVNSSKSFVAMGNYLIMDRTSRNALDQMTRNIRQAKKLTSFGPYQLVFNYDGAGKTLTYRYDVENKALTEEWPAKTTTLLQGCDRLAFSMYNRSLSNTTDVTQGKVVAVAWKCSRTILGRKLNTEDMQQAQIVIRSQP